MNSPKFVSIMDKAENLSKYFTSKLKPRYKLLVVETIYELIMSGKGFIWNHKRNGIIFTNKTLSVMSSKNHKFSNLKNLWRTLMYLKFTRSEPTVDDLKLITEQNSCFDKFYKPFVISHPLFYEGSKDIKHIDFKVRNK